MTQTLIGLFNTFDAAQNAADRLAQEGILRSDINIHAQDDATVAQDDSFGSADPDTTRDVVADRPTSETREHASWGYCPLLQTLVRR